MWTYNASLGKTFLAPKDNTLIPHPAEHPSQRLLADRAALAPTSIVLAGSTWSEEFWNTDRLSMDLDFYSIFVFGEKNSRAVLHPWIYHC